MDQEKIDEALEHLDEARYSFAVFVDMITKALKGGEDDGSSNRQTD